jgi:hypothetical protein
MKRWAVLSGVIVVMLLMMADYDMNKQGFEGLTVKNTPHQNMTARQLAWRFWNEKQGVGECFAGHATAPSPGHWVLTGRPHGTFISQQDRYSWSSVTADIFQSERLFSLQQVVIREKGNYLKARSATFNISTRAVELDELVGLWGGNRFKARSSRITKDMILSKATMVIGPTTLRADRIQWQDGVWTFQGNVCLSRGSFVADVDRVHFDKGQRKARIDGIRYIKEGSRTLKADQIWLDLKTGQWRAVGQVHSMIDL